MSRVALTETVLLATNPASYARGLQVYVYERGTTTPAALYADEFEATTVGQPLVTDQGGRPRGDGDALAWVDPGSYDLAIGGQTVPVEAAEGGTVAPLTEPVSVVEASGATRTLVAYSAATFNDITLSATTVEIKPPSAHPAGDETVTVLALVRQDGTGERAVKFPSSSTQFPSGIDVSALLTKTPDAADLLSFTWSPVDERWLVTLIAADIGAGGEAPPETAAVVRETKTYPITDAVGAASGATNYLPPMFVSIPRSGEGEKLKLIGVWAVIRGGTKAKVKVQRNGGDVTGLTEIAVTTSLGKKTLEAALELSDGDSIAPVVESVEGSPDNASIVFLFDRTLP